MSYWEGIVACDLPGYPVISLAELLDPVPSLEDIWAAVIEAFGRIFDFRMTQGEPS